MNVLITGADGFIGRALSARLLSNGGALERGDPLSRLTLLDQRFTEPPADLRVRIVTGDIADPAVMRNALDDEVDLVFHLAAVGAGLAESEFELGKRVNMDATVRLLELLRARSTHSRFVFASSIGVYRLPMQELVDENTLPAPTLSYGAQKLVGETLIADYSRHGFIDGRAVRLPVIVARPAEATRVKSGFTSDLIRDLSAGRAFTCPVAPEAAVWWMSRACAVENLLHAANLPLERPDVGRVWQLPALHASMADVVAAIARLHGEDVLRKVTYEDDRVLRAVFASFPPLRCTRSVEAGFRHDGTIENLVQRALDDLQATSHP